MYLAEGLLRPYISPFLILNIGRYRQLKSALVFDFLFFIFIRYNDFSSVITEIYPL